MLKRVAFNNMIYAKSEDQMWGVSWNVCCQIIFIHVSKLESRLVKEMASKH